MVEERQKSSAAKTECEDRLARLERKIAESEVQMRENTEKIVSEALKIKERVIMNKVERTMAESEASIQSKVKRVDQKLCENGIKEELWNTLRDDIKKLEKGIIEWKQHSEECYRV